MGPVRQWTTVLVDQCTEYRFWDMSIVSLADVSSVIGMFNFDNVHSVNFVETQVLVLDFSPDVLVLVLFWS